MYVCMCKAITHLYKTATLPNIWLIWLPWQPCIRLILWDNFLPCLPKPKWRRVVQPRLSHQREVPSNRPRRTTPHLPSPVLMMGTGVDRILSQPWIQWWTCWWLYLASCLPMNTLWNKWELTKSQKRPRGCRACLYPRPSMTPADREPIEDRCQLNPGKQSLRPRQTYQMWWGPRLPAGWGVPQSWTWLPPMRTLDLRKRPYLSTRKEAWNRVISERLTRPSLERWFGHTMSSTLPQENLPSMISSVFPSSSVSHVSWEGVRVTVHDAPSSGYHGWHGSVLLGAHPSLLCRMVPAAGTRPCYLGCWRGESQV